MVGREYGWLAGAEPCTSVEASGFYLKYKGIDPQVVWEDSGLPTMASSSFPA